MYRLERHEYVKPRLVLLWSTLAFQAGFINAFGFLAFGKYVSHVTGLGSQIGVALAAKSLWIALELSFFPITFMLGAFVSGYFTSAKIERGLKPNYNLVTALIPISILATIAFGVVGEFGTFGEQLIEQRDFNLLFMLSFICGMQNGCFATMTKGQIRTTHLTGISTDIGTDSARLFFGNLKGHERRITWLTNVSRAATFTFFTFGSVMSVLISERVQFWALTLPLATSIGAYLAVRQIAKKIDIRLANKQYFASSRTLSQPTLTI